MSNANTDEITRHELFARDLFLSDRATELDAAEKKGKAEGKAEGEIQRAKKVALKMLAKGMAYEIISEVTDLSVAIIESLASNDKVCEPTAEYNSNKPRKKRK
ncbi:MAG: hypothetical protein BWY02_01829 [bacterium ADurb.Bin157]|nr:MAG: hypothetical protein BWY02_01829 [bacterium ADurb.Bin157]